MANSQSILKTSLSFMVMGMLNGGFIPPVEVATSARKRAFTKPCISKRNLRRRSSGCDYRCRTLQQTSASQRGSRRDLLDSDRASADRTDPYRFSIL